MPFHLFEAAIGYLVAIHEQQAGNIGDLTKGGQHFHVGDFYSFFIRSAYATFVNREHLSGSIRADISTILFNTAFSITDSLVLIRTLV